MVLVETHMREKKPAIPLEYVHCSERNWSQVNGVSVCGSPCEARGRREEGDWQRQTDKHEVCIFYPHKVAVFLLGWSHLNQHGVRFPCVGWFNLRNTPGQGGAEGLLYSTRPSLADSLTTASLPLSIHPFLSQSAAKLHHYLYTAVVMNIALMNWVSASYLQANMQHAKLLGFYRVCPIL